MCWLFSPSLKKTGYTKKKLPRLGREPKTIIYFNPYTAFTLEVKLNPGKPGGR